jgi:phosphate transport system protein
MNEHLSKQFDNDLETIRSLVLQMGGLVEKQITSAIECFTHGNHDLIARVIENDKLVNNFEKQIDEDCTRLIVRRQPAANDLRLIMAVSKTVTDLERIGDKAAKIARQSRSLYEEGRMQIPRLAEIRHCAELAISMLHRALDALARQDGEVARAIIPDDAAIDEEFRAILRQLITYMMEDPRTISASLEIIWIAKAIERVGDHAKNIAENVVYIVQGTDIRHAGAAEASQVE